jgi:hypothetical protein
MTVNGSVTIWKSQGTAMRSGAAAPLGLLPVQLIRGTDILDVEAVKTLDAAYPIARRWQVECRALFPSISAAA